MARRFAKVSEEEIKTAFFYPSDLVNTKTTTPLRVGEERRIYASTLRVSVYSHHYSPPLRGIVVTIPPKLVLRNTHKQATQLIFTDGLVGTKKVIYDIFFEYYRTFSFLQIDLKNSHTTEEIQTKMYCLHPSL